MPGSYTMESHNAIHEKSLESICCLHFYTEKMDQEKHKSLLNLTNPNLFGSISACYCNDKAYKGVNGF